MTEQDEAVSRWVWVIVQSDGSGEQFLGQVDGDLNISFIPAFPEKDAALMGLGRLAREKGMTYEAQAIRLDDLRARAGQNGFAVFVLDGEGRIVERH
ncbi:conserved hypothetical protein [uncultured Desulfatiglans sp.]|nr:conserved hypothetical protein [uncultured Desulfatiglans sp.]